MHSYYKENAEKLKKGMNSYFKHIAPELEKETGVPYAKLFNEIWDYYYSQLLENFPYIGGDQVSGTGNLTGAYYFIALGAVIKKYGIDIDRWGYLSTICYQRYYAKMPGIKKKIMGMMFKNQKMATKMLKKKDAKNAENAKENPGSFETETKKPTAEYSVIYYTTVCPLSNFAKEHGYMEYMPYLCNLDYVMFEAMKVPFYREKTCAAGDGYCDFKLKSQGAVVPSWPCHELTPGDPLK